MSKQKKVVAAMAVITGIVGVGLALAQPPTGPMSFFLTSRGSGEGGNLGGLAGADRICQDLAQAYGLDQADIWLQRWRIFFMACAELWGFDHGREWFVSHYLFAPRAGR